MAKKQTDSLRDPVTMASARYKEQIDSFKAQFIPKPENPMKTLLQEFGISPQEWKDSFKNG